MSKGNKKEILQNNWWSLKLIGITLSQQEQQQSLKRRLTRFHPTASCSIQCCFTGKAKMGFKLNLKCLQSLCHLDCNDLECFLLQIMIQ